MTAIGALLLACSTVVFILAASVAKAWTLGPTTGKLVLTLALYSVGNLIMLRLVRDFGMGVAFSLSAVIQLVAVNLVAFGLFGERVNTLQSAGIAIAILAVGLISFGPYLSSK